MRVLGKYKLNTVFLNRQIITWDCVVPTGGTEQRTDLYWRRKHLQPRPRKPSSEVVNHSTGPCSVCRNSSLQFRSFLSVYRWGYLDRLGKKSHQKCGKRQVLNAFYELDFSTILYWRDHDFPESFTSRQVSVQAYACPVTSIQRTLCGL